MGGNPSILAPKLLSNTISLSSYIDILDSLNFEKVIQDSRFLKSLQCTNEKDGGEYVLVKLFVKPDAAANSSSSSDNNASNINNGNGNGNSIGNGTGGDYANGSLTDSGDVTVVNGTPEHNQEATTATTAATSTATRDKSDLKYWRHILDKQRSTLSRVPGVITFDKFIETERAAYLIRQYLNNNLYDRLSTRPFLEPVEKIWIIYQLLNILAKCHELGITHGDIKTENVLVTTWNSVYLTDFASYKPTYLPEDNPGEFFFYFDTSQRRNCYLAPERFLSKNLDANDPIQKNKLNDEVSARMDIFSLGCVIAELYLEGGSIFTLSQLFKYKNGTYYPNLQNVSNDNVKSLIKSMISLNPKDRKSATEYLQIFKNSIFPQIFYNFLGDYINGLIHITPPDFTAAGSLETNNKKEATVIKRLKECDYRIEKMYNEYDKIAQALELKYEVQNSNKEDHRNLNEVALFPVSFNLPGIPRNYVMKSTKNVDVSNNLPLLLLNIIISSLRNTYVASSRIKGIELLIALSERVHDEAKLDRCIPFLASLLDDECVEVRILALKSLTQIISMVDVITPLNALIFPEYIIPKIKIYLTKEYCLPYEKMFFAVLLPNLALNIIRFYELGQILKSNSLETMTNFELELENDANNLDIISSYSPSSPSSSSDISKQSLIEIIEMFTVLVLTGDENTKISLLSNIHILCAVIGKEKTNDIVLSHLITYLNDKSSALRLAFVKSIIGISIYVGTISLEQYILPLLVQSLSDPEEFIVIQVLQNFTELVKLGVIKKHDIWELTKNISKLILHPNEWIRQAAIIFIITVSQKLLLADVFCTLYPIIRPYLEYEVTEFGWDSLYPCAKRPIPRSVYNLAFTWCQHASNTAFWENNNKNAATAIKKNSANGTSSSSSITKSITGMLSKVTGEKNKKLPSPNAGSRTFSVSGGGAGTSSSAIQLTSEDKSWVKRLRASGLLENDLWKVYALKDHIKKASRSQSLKEKSEIVITEIQKLGAFPRNVFLDIVFKPLMERSGNTGNTELSDTHKIDDDNGGEKVLKSDNESVFSTVSQNNNFNVPVISDETGMLLFTLKKATPSILTNQENVYGELDSVNQSLLASSLNLSADNDNVAKRLDKPPVHPIITHSYNGNNEHVLKFLNNYDFITTLENFYEFGPSITLPLEDNLSNIIANKNKNSKSWPPKGTLVAHLLEHEGAINCLVTSPDYSYFVSGGEDGYLKIWDALRLERNVTSKSTLSINLKFPVKNVCFIQNRDCFAVSTKTNVKIYRVCRTAKDHYKIRKLVQIRSFKFQKTNEYATAMEFVVVENKPLLILITSLSQILAIDVRTMTVEYKLQNSLAYGVTTTFCADSRGTWIIVGTNKGYLTLWDLRFKLNLKSWKFTTGKPIKKLSSSFNTYKHSFFSLLSDNNGLSIYDISKGKIQEVYCINKNSKSDNNSKLIELNDDDEFDIEADDDNLLSMKTDSFLFDELEETIDLERINQDNIEAEDSDEYKMTSFTELKVSTSSHKKQLYLFSSKANTHRIMFWDIFHPDNSKMISQAKTASSNGGSRDNTKQKRHRSRLIFNEQKEAIRNHHDVITDMTLLCKPYFMIVSGDRNGVINVYK